MKTSLDSLKRTGLMVCFLFSLGLTIHAQHWALPSSHWSYTTYNSGLAGPGYTTYGPIAQVAGDTLINGTSCRRVLITYDPVGYGFTTQYTFESGDTAFIFINGAFHPYMYFNVQAGDTVGLWADTSSTFGIHRGDARGVVDSVDSVILNGRSFRQYTLHFIDSGFRQLFPYIYAERLGVISTYDGFFYPSFDFWPDGYTTWLCGYRDSTYSTELINQTCRSLLGTHDLSHDLNISCHPNPSTGTFTIDLPMPGEKLLHIYDIAGREVLNQAVSDQQLTARLTVAGIYMVEVQQEQSRYRSKVVVQ